MKNFTKIMLVSCLVLLSDRIQSSASLSSVLTTNNISTLYCMSYSGTSVPTSLVVTPAHSHTNFPQVSIPLPTYSNLSNGYCVLLTQVVSNNAYATGDVQTLSGTITYQMNDCSGKSISLGTQSSNITTGEATVQAETLYGLRSRGAKLNRMFLNLYAGSTSLFNVVDAIPYSPAAFMIVNSSTWDVVTPMTTLPPSTTGLGSYLAQQGISQVSGISLQKAVIDQDLCMVTVTSQGISNQIVSNSAIYTLTGSNAIMNNISTLTNGVYVAINSWDQGATYTLYDNQGNSLGTGTVSVFGSSSGTILGGILSSSGFQYGKFALQAVNGKIPRCMLLQYPAPTPYSAPSSGSGSGSAGSVNFAQIATLALSIQDLSKELSPLNAQLKSAVGKTAKQTINAQINTIQNSIMTAQASIKKAQVVLSGTALYTGAFKSTGGSSVPVQRGTTIFNIPAATLPAGGLQFINVGLTDAASSGWMVFEFDNTIISQFPAAVLSAGLYVAIEILKLGLAFTAKVSLMDSNEGIYAYGKQQIPAGAVLTQANVGFNMNDTSIAPVANQVRVNGVPLTHPSPLVLFQAQAAATS